ncbi:phage protease [Luteolibacter flavescens]|uniref:Phage protease n=1 Tax=Luteolibacter flavescens TaxID=1859460 RepID=A0ABT3FKZ7_9BACT|nr:phage protease [Luteolibacter flavescens]MCW1884009.1 phage protease [Luteolibacter flavescens]
MNAKILNRGQDAPPSDGWYQIEVCGTWPAGHWPDEHARYPGRQRRQVIDAKAIESIVNRFAAEKASAGDNFAGILVDNDHLSHDLDKSTAAFAWAKDLRVKDGQLEARLDLTDLGEPAIRNKRFKFFSTEFDPEDLEDLGNGDVRPLRLSGLAFTNRPNNRGGRPITNRTGAQPDNPTEPTKPPMKAIAEKLGLPADADEAAILAKITEIMGSNETMKTKEAETEADAIMNTLGKNIPEGARAHWRGELIKNRASAEAAIKLSFPANATREEPARIFNRGTATSPAPVEKTDGAQDDGPTAAEKKQAAAIRNRASAIQATEKVPFATAFARAQAELG